MSLIRPSVSHSIKGRRLYLFCAVERERKGERGKMGKKTDRGPSNYRQGQHAGLMKSTLKEEAIVGLLSQKIKCSRGLHP